MRGIVAEIFGTMAVPTVLLWAAFSHPPEAAVAVSHRHTQARTDAQPVLKDDLASQKPDTGNSSATPNSSDLGEVIGAHLQASTREVWTYGASWCGFCNQMAREIPNAPQPGLKWNYTHVPVPEWVKGLLPVNVNRESLPLTVLWDTHAAGTKKVAVKAGYMTSAQIVAWAKQNPPPAIPQAVSIGRIQLKSAIAALLDKVQSDRSGAAVVTLGSASVLLPASMPMTVSATHEQVGVTFTGAKPRARYALLGCDITGVTATRDRMTVSLAGMPDLVMQVE